MAAHGYNPGAMHIGLRISDPAEYPPAARLPLAFDPVGRIEPRIFEVILTGIDTNKSHVQGVFVCDFCQQEIPHGAPMLIKHVTFRVGPKAFVPNHTHTCLGCLPARPLWQAWLTFMFLAAALGKAKQERLLKL